MIDTMTRFLAGVNPPATSFFLRKIIEPLVDRCSTHPLISANLVITGAGGTAAKIGATDFYASCGGILVKIAAGTVMPALTGINIAANAFNVVSFFVDSVGVVTLGSGTAGPTLARVVLQAPPLRKATVGLLIITSASPFVGGTTALDTATTVYISPTGAFDPTVLV